MGEKAMGMCIWNDLGELLFVCCHWRVEACLVYVGDVLLWHRKSWSYGISDMKQ